MACLEHPRLSEIHGTVSHMASKTFPNTGQCKVLKTLQQREKGHPGYSQWRNTWITNYGPASGDVQEQRFTEKQKLWTRAWPGGGFPEKGDSRYNTNMNYGLASREPRELRFIIKTTNMNYSLARGGPPRRATYYGREYELWPGQAMGGTPKPLIQCSKEKKWCIVAWPGEPPRSAIHLKNSIMDYGLAMGDTRDRRFTMKSKYEIWPGRDKKSWPTYHILYRANKISSSSCLPVWRKRENL